MRPPPFVVLNKKVGETPLEALQAWKAAHTEYQDVLASYAGRLDPMADGLLLVLLGDECKKQETYRRLDKEYVVQVVLDLGTDTGDALGLPTYANEDTNVSPHKLSAALATQNGTHTVPYPAYSSKTVAGKPLFLYALEGTLDTISSPSHEETIYTIAQLPHKHVSKRTVEKRIDSILQNVPKDDAPSKVLGADFRQDAIRAAWQELFATLPDRTFTILTLRVTCGSGAYMRTLAQRIGAALGTSAFALSITRTKIGSYIQLPFGLGVWTKRFR